MITNDEIVTSYIGFKKEYDDMRIYENMKEYELQLIMLLTTALNITDRVTLREQSQIGT